MSDRQALVGKRFPAHVHTATSAETQAYAKATNDTNPIYDSATIAPPMFAVFLEMPPMMEAAKAPEIIIDPARFLRLLHGEHDLRWHKPLVPGTTYSTVASVARITEKASGEIVDLRMETTDASGALCVETMSSLFYRGEGKPGAEAKAPPAEAAKEAPPPLLFSVDEHVAGDQSLRYADASGDHNPIHKDPAAAQKAGLPGIILHGLCTMAFCQKALINQLCAGNPNKLARLKVRFARPVLMGQTLTISAWDLPSPGAKRVVGFDARVAGAHVLKDCLAELA